MATIVDISKSIAGAFCAKLLGLKGDRVIWSGDADHDSSCLNDYLRGSFGGAEVPPPSPAEFAELVRRADVVIQGTDLKDIFRDYITIHDINPGVVQIIVSSFGQRGPYSSYRAGPLVDWAASGYLYLTGQPSRRPLPGPTYACSYATGYFAALAAEIGLRMRNGGSEGISFDVASMDVMSALHQTTFTTYAATKEILRRHPHAPRIYPHDAFECADGWVSVAVVTDPQYDAFASAVDKVELVTDPRFQTPQLRFEHADEFDIVVRDWFMSHTTTEIVTNLQDRGVPAIALEDCHSIVKNGQLGARHYWTKYSVGEREGVAPGDPIRIVATEGRSVDRKATKNRNPIVSRQRRTDSTLPLAGLVVVDLTQYWAGPLATRLLADLGATVIMVERSSSRPHRNKRGIFFDWQMHRGKASLAVDLKSDGGPAVVRDLVAQSDVLVENFRPGVLKRLGLGYERLCCDRAGFVYASLSGFGHSGPQESWASYGPLLEAASSIQALTRYVCGPPTLLGQSLPDPLGGIAGAFAVLNALRQSEYDGLNRHIDLSQLEVCTAVCGEEILAASLGENASAPNRFIYRCRGDDEWIVIEISSPEEATVLRDVLGCRAASDNGSIADRMRHFDKYELARMLQEQGVSAFGVLRNVDLACDQSLREREAVIDADIDGAQVRMPGFPIPSLASGLDMSAQSPTVGQDSWEVLKMIGYDNDQILRLLSAGIVYA